MRMPLPRFVAALLPLVWLASSPDARAQSDAPGGPLPALPPASLPGPEPASPPAPSAAPPAPPSDAPTAPPASAPPSAPTGEPVALYIARYRHQGFYFAADTGLGVMTAFGSGPLGSASLTGPGSVGAFAVGGTVAPGLVLGGVVREWSTSGTFNGGPNITATTTYVLNGKTTMSTQTLSGNAHAMAVEIAALLDWYPNPENGWHFGGSIGLGAMTLTDDAGTRTTGGGLAGSVFGGYQWWLGPAWSLGISGVVSIANAGHLDDSNQNDTGYKFTPMGFGLQCELLYY
jgi:hypothetical protein